jgi:ARID/BRIGHT DNA binding domain
MFASKEEEKERFKKNLFSFLQSRGATNLKVPQIGGKELDLYELYQSVIRKGGAQKVSNSKLWKEIVNEFDLPPSCTSASFTLKNHYQKYLLAYEQKFFFGKNEDEMIRELGNVRQRRPHNDPDKGFKTESKI